jgi:hypothetical protein
MDALAYKMVASPPPWYNVVVSNVNKVIVVARMFTNIVLWERGRIFGFSDLLAFRAQYEGKMELSHDIVSFFLLSARLLGNSE